MWKKIDAWLCGIEQRLAKWRRARTPEYRAGRKSRRKGVNHWMIPYARGTGEAELWMEGWMDEEGRT